MVAGQPNRSSQLNAISKEKGADKGKNWLSTYVYGKLYTKGLYLIMRRGNEKYTGRKTKLIVHVTA